MTIQEISSDLKSGILGYKFDARELRLHVLDRYVPNGPFRVGVAVSFESLLVGANYIPILRFQRVEYDQNTNILSFIPLGVSITPELVLINSAGFTIASNYYTDNSFGSADLIANYDLCMFNKSQFDIITKFSSEVIFSGTTINYGNSAYFFPTNNPDYPVDPNIDYFTLKLEGQQNAKTFTESNGGIPVIELAAPCPPFWDPRRND